MPGGVQVVVLPGRDDGPKQPVAGMVLDPRSPSAQHVVRGEGGGRDEEDGTGAGTTGGGTGGRVDKGGHFPVFVWDMRMMRAVAGFPWTVSSNRVRVRVDYYY